MLKNIHKAVLAITLLIASHAASAAEMYDLTINFTGMTPHVGQMMALRVVEDMSGMTVADTSISSVEGVSFQLSFPMALTQGMDYSIDFYADHNRNGAYDAPPADHAWRLMAADVMGDVTLNFAHNTSFTNVMYPAASGAFSLIVNFTGMTPHVNQMLELRVVDTLTGYVAADTSVDPVPGPAFMLTFENALQPGRAYNVDFYADHNRNGTYDAPPADHAWRMMVASVDSAVSLDFAHNTSFTDVGYPANPGPYDFTLTLSGMTPHLSQAFYLRVVDSLSGTQVADTMLASIDTTDFSIWFNNVISSGSSYYVDFYADHNGNAAYDAPPADHAWRMMASGVMGNVTLTFAHNTSFTDIMYPSVSGPFNLTLDFTGMTPHVGQMLKLRVVDQGSGFVGADTMLMMVPSAAFQFMFAGALQVGRSYNIDFYADHNRNGTYDAPPADHAWRMTVMDAGADTMLTFAHNTSFTDVAYPDGPCTCDIDGDGMSDMADLAAWSVMRMMGSNLTCLDRDGDGILKINDAVLLLRSIRNGTCPSMTLLAGTAGNENEVAELMAGLSAAEREEVLRTMELLGLSADEREQFLAALYGVGAPAELPRAFSLAQNSPNPFNPSTSISYAVPEGSSTSVSLKVYDLRGRLIRTLVDGVKESGTYTVFWDGTDKAGRKVSSGVYFYTMQAGEFAQTRKMVLLK